MKNSIFSKSGNIHIWRSLQGISWCLRLFLRQRSSGLIILSVEKIFTVEKWGQINKVISDSHVHGLCMTMPVIQCWRSVTHQVHFSSLAQYKHWFCPFWANPSRNVYLGSILTFNHLDKSPVQHTRLFVSECARPVPLINGFYWLWTFYRIKESSFHLFQFFWLCLSTFLHWGHI